VSGILGQIEPQRPVDPVVFARMLAALATRGPDGEGTRVVAGGRVALGHRRLAIQGLAESAAGPIANATETLWLTLDGEIYNSCELGKELAAQGHLMRSNANAEVVLHAYAEWGDDCLLRLRGTFAFGLWDVRRERLLLARDRLGIKPLYYRAQDGRLIFASQPRAILEHPQARREVDAAVFHHCLMVGHAPGDLGVWMGIAKLPAAHRLVLDRRGLRCERYWEIRYAPSVRKAADAARLVRSKLEEAVRLQLASEVPVGVDLSGGIGSPTLAAIAMCTLERKLPGFEVGFGEGDPEERRIAQLARGLFAAPAHAERMPADGAAALLRDLIVLSDEPCFGAAGVRTLAASRLARCHGVPVMLVSDGADEVFAGRDGYQGASAKRPHAWRRLRRALGAGRLLPGFDPAVLPSVTRLQLADLRTSLAGDVLSQIDRASMACGVAMRLPFLDHELVETAFTIDSRVLFAGGERLALLKRAVASWLPPEVLVDRQRRGDGSMSAAAEWQAQAEALLPDGVLVSRGLLRRDALAGLLAAGQSIAAQRLAHAELWARHWLEPSSGPV
jgi:asparagine synthase (glutamine-hydrolysing)